MMRQAAGTWAGAIVLLVNASPATADGPSPRAQQLELDTESGEFVETAPPVEGTALGDLQLARQAMAREDHGKANRRIKKWLKTYGDQDQLGPDALLLRAEIEIARRDYYKAHKHLQEFLDEYEMTRHSDRAIELEFVIAEVFLSGTKRKLWGMRILSSKDIGLEILDELSSRYTGSEVAEAAIKTKADHYFSEGEFALAELEYSRLMQEFPRSRYSRFAMRRSADAALASFPGIEFDDAALIEAEERFNQYLAQYPSSAEQEGVGQILERIHQTRAEKEYSIGRYYERTKHLDAAAFYYRSTRDNWPETIAATQAEQRLVMLGALEEAGIEVAPDPQETESSS